MKNYYIVKSNGTYQFYILPENKEKKKNLNKNSKYDEEVSLELLIDTKNSRK